MTARYKLTTATLSDSSGMWLAARLVLLLTQNPR